MSNLTFIPKDHKEDKRLANGQAMERLLKNEDFKLFTEELSLRRGLALQNYLTTDADESKRQRVLAFDEAIGIPQLFIKMMEVSLMEKQWSKNGRA